MLRPQATWRALSMARAFPQESRTDARTGGVKGQLERSRDWTTARETTEEIGAGRLQADEQRSK
jgi:hypothetical protein